MAKCEKKKYRGVYFRVQERLDGCGEEKPIMSLLTWRVWDKLIDESVGCETEGMTGTEAKHSGGKTHGAKLCLVPFHVDRQGIHQFENRICRCFAP